MYIEVAADTRKCTFGNAQNLRNICSVDQEHGLSVWNLVQLDFGCLWVNGEPVVGVRALGIPTLQMSQRSRRNVGVCVCVCTPT